MLTISKLKRSSVSYYIDTAKAAGRASSDLQKANGGLGEYYSEHETRTPVWLCAGDTHTAARLVGLTDVQRAGGKRTQPWWRGGLTTVSRPTARADAPSQSAVCTASI